MNDIEIIKALEICGDCGHCTECPFDDLGGIDKCMHTLILNALDLILRLKSDVNNYRTRVGNQKQELARLNEQVNEQKAEIKRLYKENEIKSQKRANIFEIANAYERGKSEAITEFAERLKITDLSGVVGEHYINGEMYGYFDSGSFGSIIDNLVAEMTEGNDNG